MTLPKLNPNTIANAALAGVIAGLVLHYMAKRREETPQ